MGGAGWATVPGPGDDEGWRVRGRRTAWWRAGTWRGGPPVAARLGAVAAVLCATAALPHPAARAAEPPGYAFARDARRIDGAGSTADAVRLETGKTYRSSLSARGKAHYRLELDAASNAYVSVTAVPAPGSTVSAVDGVRVSVQDADGHSCSYESETFGASHSPHPVTAWGSREISAARTLCKDAGTYYVAVERADPGNSPPDAWDLEITTVSEPGLKRAGGTRAPQVWDSASPEPVTGEPRRRRGGAGFSAAAPLGQGAWRDDITPGQTLYYAVPVDWGQQLYATAELGSSSGGSGYTTGALNLTLYNPVRGHVEDDGASYRGDQESATLDPVPPVGHDNRFAVPEQVSGMRFAGTYYLVVHLAEQVADGFGEGPFGLTLRVRVRGAAQSGPSYAGESVPRNLFEVTAQDRAAATVTGGTEGGDSAMTALAVGGIGTGSALLAGLGVWTAVARRRGAGAHAGRA
ncbi:hypothetical protein GCM10010129_49380 [Streptomyces fumigatiscleroticus]|nr:hypothetical protein GCM10010129_49380 [Streptomyces fumigatiscleroticus]